MAGSDDDDDFSDEDLDALTAHDFYQLQENAIRSTQAAVDAAQVATAIPKSFSKPGGDRSSDYGDIDDDLMLNEDLLDDQNEGFIEQPAPVAHDGNQSAPGESTQREQWRQNRYAANQASATVQRFNGFGQPPDPGIPSKQKQSPAMNANADQDVVMLDVSPKDDSAELVALQAKISELLREKETLQHAVKMANDNAFTKAGEAAIIRAKQEKLAKEHDQQLAAVQRANAETAARQKAELEAACTEAETLATRNKYLEHDIQEETLRAKQLQRKSNAPVKNATMTLEYRPRPRNTTPPRKSRILDHGDGFDDDAFAPLSPSHGRQQKVGTPKAGEKRKRKAMDKSPGLPLRLTQPVRADSAPEDEVQLNLADDPIGNTSTVAAMEQPAIPVPQLVQKEDHRFKFTQAILNYRLGYEEKPCVDQLAKFAFPSDPETVLSSLFHQELGILTVSRDDDFPASVASIFIKLWARCLDEKYYPPIPMLLPLTTHIIALSPLKTGPLLAQDSALITLTQLTADINVLPRFKRAPPASLNPDIDTPDCLKLLSLTASACAPFPDATRRFWRSMRFDFILMALSTMQPLLDITLMLQVLEYSVLETSFAMVVPPDDGEQSASEVHVFDKISALLLNDQPRSAPPLDHDAAIALANLRLAALTLLEKASETDYGAEALARNPNAIGRLVRMVNDEINAMYDYKAGHAISTELVNRGTLLLHFLTSRYKDVIDMGEKLGAVQGGKDKFMIAMARLAFCEPVFFERGIEEATIECAHLMLDGMVDHKEAREANEVFGRGD